MHSSRPFRFGHQVRPGDPATCIAEAQQAEAAGFDIVTIPDHVGTDMHSPMVLASAIAHATSTIRLGTFVLNNEMRNPVQLAWEASTLDHVSAGRFELGLGAGHTPHEFAATGLSERTARERKNRLIESSAIIRQLLDGETVSHRGEHYTIDAAAVSSTVQPRLPILIGGNGDMLLHNAGQHADVVGLNGLGRRLPDGHRHAVKFNDDWLEHQVSVVRAGAIGRVDAPEINVLVQRVVVTPDRQAAAEEIAEQVEDLTPSQALTTPYLALGTHEEIGQHFVAMRERFGITYFVTRDIEAMMPVITSMKNY